MLALELLASLARSFRSTRSLERRRDAALRRLVDHAWRHVPFYRRRLELAGVRPEDILTTADLARLPPLSRRELQETPLADRLAAGCELEHCVSHQTSGASGEPLRIVRTPEEEARLFAYRLRAQVLSGVRPWHLRTNVGSPRRLFPWHRMGLFRVSTVPQNTPIELMRERLQALDPDVIQISPETLEQLLGHSDRARLPRPRLVLTGANQLRPSLRRRTEEILGAKVVDFYGASECNLIAWECRRCGVYHTSDDSVIVEVVREDGWPAAPGETGEVLVTALHSYAMPFVRYRIGDLAARPAERRRCAVRFGALERIEGRVIDYLRFPGGERMSPFPLLDAIDALPAVGRWQAVQHSETRIEVWFEPLGRADQTELARAIEASCRALVPDGVEITVRRAAGFDGATTTKHRFVRSLCATT